MDTKELRVLIGSYLDLVENGVGSVEENQKSLRLHLDKLAMASYGEFPEDPVKDLDAPGYDYDEIRIKVGPLFPNYGFYKAPNVEPLADNTIGDAIDNISDIARDLKGVIWQWDNACENDAMWNFNWSFIAHWGYHLRLLQWYLYELDVRGKF